MKLLYITNQISGPGGLERVLSIKASYFADHLNYEVHIVSLNEANKNTFFPFSPNINFHNLYTSSNPIRYIFNYFIGLKRIIRNIKPEIILVCDDGIKGLLLPRLIAENYPFIYERHVSKKVTLGTSIKGFIHATRGKLLNSIMHWGGKRYDAFVVLTNGNLKEWKLKNLSVIPNPLPFKPNQKSTLSNNTVIAVGKHSFQKGYDRLVKAWAIVYDRYPNWKLAIYGSPNKDNDLRPLINNLGLQNSILLFNPVKDIQDKLSNASIHVLSSRYEGFGMVIIEAMACGLPSISYDCNYGPSDIIEHNINGILVEEGAIDKLGMAMISLIQNEAVRKRMGDNARNSIDKYLIESIANKWEALFSKVVQDNYPNP